MEKDILKLKIYLIAANDNIYQTLIIISANVLSDFLFQNTRDKSSISRTPGLKNFLPKSKNSFCVI